ncbi:MAG: helix-turn-helix domain-containing protein [Nanoarchaeota archaeon]
MEKALEEVGFSKNESKVYLTLLNLGPSQAGAIAEKSKVYRTNVYESLQRLIEKGLVSYIFKGHQKIFQAEDPTKIMNILKEKEESFRKILPQLTLNNKLAKNKEKVTIYEGINGVKAILWDVLKDKEETNSFNEVLAFGIAKDSFWKMRTFANQYHKKRIELKLPQKHLYDENAKRRIAFLNKMSYTEAAYIPNTVNSPAVTQIYGDKVAFFIWSDPILSILIESKRMAEMYRRYFYILYSISVRENPDKVLREGEELKQKLNNAEETLNKFMNSTEEGFLLFDSNLNLVEVNNAALTRIKLPRGDLIGKNILEISPDVKESGRYETYLKVLKTGEVFIVKDVKPHEKFGGPNVEIKAVRIGNGLGIVYRDLW